MNAPTKPARKSTNVSLPSDLVAGAKQLGINLSRACEAGLAAALREERKRRWQEENLPAAQAWNDWINENGMPLSKHRQF